MDQRADPLGREGEENAKSAFRVAAGSRAQFCFFWNSVAPLRCFSFSSTAGLLLHSLFLALGVYQTLIAKQDVLFGIRCGLSLNSLRS